MKKFIALIIITLSLLLNGCEVPTTTTTSNNQPTSTTTTLITTTTTTITTSEITTTQRVFTLEELAAYTGYDGTTAYIAVNGVVYDVTHDAEWSNGSHKGMHYAGTDASAAFAGSPHGESILLQLPIVGILG
jgi:predicted heme/steroid binding protein